MALSLVAGIVGVAILATLAGARRTSSAFDRLLVSSKAYDVEVSVIGEVPPDTLERVSALPQVEESGRVALYPATGDIDADRFEWNLSVGSIVDDALAKTFEIPRVVAGRMPDYSDPREAAVSVSFAEARGLSIGDEVTFRALTFEEMFQLFGGAPVKATLDPVTVRVVGIIRLPHDVELDVEQGSGEAGAMYTTPALYRQIHGSVAQLEVMFVRLRPGQRADDFVAAARATVEGSEEALDFKTATDLRAVASQALDVQATALTLFAVLAALGGVVIVAQSISRGVRGASSDVPVLDALGMGRPRRALALSTIPVIVAVTGGIIAVAGAVLASAFMPLGFARTIEPHLGIHFDGAVLALGGALFTVSLIVVALPAVLISARAGGRTAEPTRSPSTVAESLARAGVAPAAVTGVRFALNPRVGDRTIPLRAALLGGAVSVLAVVGAITFQATFGNMVSDPKTYGWTWDGDTAGGEDEEILAAARQSLIGRRDLSAIARLDVMSVQTRAGLVKTFAFTPVRGAITPLMTEGRVPSSAREVALAPRAMKALGASVGSVIALPAEGEACGAASSCSLDFRVVGRAILPPIDGNRLGWGMVISPEARDLLARTGGYTDMIVRFAPGTDGDAVAASLEDEYGGFLEPYAFPEVKNLERVRSMPVLLALLLGVVGLASLVHTLITSVAVRRRDLAILKTLGFVRGQVRATVATQATTLLLLALAVAVPAGVALGRWGWRALTARSGIEAPVVTPVLAVALVALAAIVIANAVAAAPARTAAMTEPATVLRTE